MAEHEPVAEFEVPGGPPVGSGGAALPGAVPADAEPADAVPVDAQPIDAQPIDAEPIDAEPIDAEPIDGKPQRWRLITAIALPLIAVLVIVLLGKYVANRVANDPTEPLTVGIVPQPGSISVGCVALDAALPAELDGRARRTMAVNEPGVAGWGSPAVVMRCGVTDPAELTCSARLTVYNGVTWLELYAADLTTYIAVDRSSRVALTVDNSAGVGAVQALSNIIGTVMPARAVCTGGVVNPVDGP